MDLPSPSVSFAHGPLCLGFCEGWSSARSGAGSRSCARRGLVRASASPPPRPRARSEDVRPCRSSLVPPLATAGCAGMPSPRMTAAHRPQASTISLAIRFPTNASRTALGLGSGPESDGRLSLTRESRLVSREVVHLIQDSPGVLSSGAGAWRPRSRTPGRIHR